MVRELHSLSRHPPIGLDDAACDALEEAGLVIATVPRHPRRNEPGRRSARAGRYRLTELGKQRRDATAHECGLEHCACKGGADADDVERHIADAMRKVGLVR
jgi:hypothetical protein